MGKLKRKNWQYQSSKERKVDPGLLSAVNLAMVEWNTRKSVAEKMAVNKEVNDILKANSMQVSNEFTDWDYGCAALALHRRYGYDAYECGEFLTAMQDITRDCVSSGMDHADIWDLVRDEIGLDITVED